MLNYFGNRYQNPPNGFLNTFDDVEEELFREKYRFRELYVPAAFSAIAQEKGRSFSLVFEGVRVHKDGEEQIPGSVYESQIQSFAEDYIRLRNAWINRILQEPTTYIAVRAYFVLRFLLIDTPPVFLLTTGGFFNGVSLLIVGLVLAFHLRGLTTPFVLLAWSAVLNGLPLFVFLPADGPGNIRYLYWFFTALFIAIAHFCSQSKLFQEIVKTTQKYLEEKVYLPDASPT
jgi:hypothetical protein